MANYRIIIQMHDEFGGSASKSIPLKDCPLTIEKLYDIIQEALKDLKW